MATDDRQKRRVLFVCTQNRLRSPTAETIFSSNPQLEVRSAGLNRDAPVTVTRDLLEWADIIYVMEKRQRNIIHKQFRDLYQRKRIICLYIPDDYEYMEPELIDLLEQRLPQYVAAS